jgi:hypothetical protein
MTMSDEKLYHDILNRMGASATYDDLRDMIDRALPELKLNTTRTSDYIEAINQRDKKIAELQSIVDEACDVFLTGKPGNERVDKTYALIGRLVLYQQTKEDYK